jgi:hypothetical protein
VATVRPSSGTTLVAALVLVLATAGLFTQAAAAVTWSTPADLSVVGESAARPEVAAGPDGSVHAVWVRSDGTDVRVETARFAGSAWSDALILSGAGDAEYPQVAVDASGRAIAVWRRKVNATQWRIEAKTFDGTAWGTAESLSADSTTATTPAIAMNASGTATVVWVLGGNIQARRYTPAGGWSATTTALSSSGANLDPDVAIDAGGDATVVWRSSGRTGGAAAFEVLAGRYNGTLVGALAVLDFDGSRPFQQPRVAANAGGVAVATWTHYSSVSNRDALNAALYDGSSWLDTGGGSPQSYVQIVNPASDDALEPQVVVDPSGFGTLIWADLPATGNPKVAARTPFVSLSSTGATSDVAAGAGMLSPKPQLALGSDGLPRAVWENSGGATTVIQTRRYGGLWEPTTTTLSDGTGSATYPQIAIGPDGVTTVVWQRFDGANTIVQATRWPIPNAPTAVSATSLAGGRASIAFSADPMTGLPDGTVGVSGNAATCTSPDGGTTRTASGAASPIVVSGLTPGKNYNCSVVSSHAAGPSAASGATAAFLSGYALAVTGVTGSGTITDDAGQMACTGACSATQVAGSAVTLTASPAPGWQFAGWGGACDGSPGSTCTVDMSQARDVSAAFAPVPVAPGTGIAPTTPDAPTGARATAGLLRASVSWSAPVRDGGAPVTRYTATARPGGATCTTTSTGCVIRGLRNTVAYTITVTASNAAGTGSASAPTAAVRPFRKLSMKRPRATAARLASRVRVTGPATITQAALRDGSRTACRARVRATRSRAYAIACRLNRPTRTALRARSQVATVVTTVLTRKGASLQATHRVRLPRSR